MIHTASDLDLSNKHDLFEVDHPECRGVAVSRHRDRTSCNTVVVAIHCKTALGVFIHSRRLVRRHSPRPVINIPRYKKEGNVLFNDALNTFYLRLYGVGHMVEDDSDSERGNPLPPHGLLFPFICTSP